MEKQEYIYVENKLLGKNKIKLNKKYYDQYLKMVKAGYLAYQSLDMAKIGSVRFATPNDINNYLHNRKRYESLLGEIYPDYQKRNFELLSDIEIFKMKRDNKYNYKYLIQIDPHVQNHLVDVINLIYFLKPNDQYNPIFLPYIPNNYQIKDSNIKIESHNVYQKINIVNNQEFVFYLKSIIPDEMKRGELIYELNKLFFFYDHMLATLSEYSDMEVTDNNLIDAIIKIQQKNIYGVSKKQIANRLWKRNQMLEDYNNNKLDCDSNKLYDDYYKYLGGLNKIEEDQGTKQYIRRCNASSINPGKLTNLEINKLGKPKNDQDYDQYYNICKRMEFAPIDFVENLIQKSVCENLIQQISNENIKKTIAQIGFSDKVISSKCFTIQDQTIGRFSINEEYMPEWYDYLNKNNINEAYEHRQLLVGDTNTTLFFRNCSMLFRSDPFISKGCDLPGLVHDVEINKIIVSCIAGSDDVFPIRITNGKLIESARIYESFEKTDQDSLIGSLIIPLKGERTLHQPRYYILYIYYNDTIRFKLRPVDFRANVIIPGTIIEYVRMLYLEMNVLLYYQNDMGTKLNFYKLDHGDNFDIYVSKYNLEEIKNKYRQIDSFKEHNLEHLNKLQQVDLVKDHDKKFKFINRQTGGSNGSNKSNLNDYIFNFKCPDDCQWNIQTGKDSVVFDKEVFSITLYQKQLNLINEFYNIAGKEIFNAQCTPINYLKGTTTPNVAKLQKKQLEELWKKERIYKKDTKGKLYVDTLKIIKKNQSILSYNFESTISIYIYNLLNSYLKPDENSKYLFFSKNHYALDGVIYYNKYKKLFYKPSDIIFYAFEYENKLFEKAENYLKVNNIDKKSIFQPMNNQWIKNNGHINQIDYAIIDIVIGIEDLENIRYSYLFQSQLPAIILTLEKLVLGGTMMVNTCLIPNKMIFNFMVYVSCFFGDTKVIDFKESELHGTGQLIFSFITFHNYKGGIDLKKLYELNEIFFKLDPTGGYKFNTKDQNIRKLLNIQKDFSKSADQYINNIIDFNTSLEKQYEEYKEYSKMKLMGSIRNFNNRMDIYLHQNDQKFITQKCNTAKIQAIHYAKEYELPLLDWVNEIPEKYFEKMITNKFKNIGFVIVEQLNKSKGKIDIGTYDKIKCDSCVELIKNISVAESAYQYIEKINYDKYKDIELFINNMYKQLNKDLLKLYNININGKYVSRAWIKFYELLSETELLESFKNVNEISVFFSCEAPGNFINSMNHFIEESTKIKKFNWNAQSLSQDLADIYDHYGFMKQTKDKWDMGPKKTGDILDLDNLKYYLKKYKDSDLYISDCGEAWTGKEIPNNKNIYIYELFYALLIPRKGGNFVIKSFSANNNKLYLSLLYLITHQYEKIHIFKSNTNFWSPEIYIIGINNQGLDNNDENTLFEIIEKVNQGYDAYPIKSIPDEFVNNYNDIMYKLISFAADIKKFFVFLSTNEGIYNRHKSQIKDIINKKNKEWGDKYIQAIQFKI